MTNKVPGSLPFPAWCPWEAPGRVCLTLTSSSLLSRSMTLMMKSLAISKFCRPMLSELSSTKRMSMGPHLHSAGKEGVSPWGPRAPLGRTRPPAGTWGFWAPLVAGLVGSRGEDGDGPAPQGHGGTGRA